MQQHFVQFYSPGTFVAEVTERPIDSWDVEQAKGMVPSIKERYGATPYGFRFVTRSREEHELDSQVSERSPMYYLGGKVETLADVEARATAEDSILLANMRCNGIDRIVTNDNSWRATLPLNAGDVVLDWNAA